MVNKQAIGYARVSTEQQVKEGLSLDAQKKSIEDWCEFNGYELIGVFVDKGISGKSMKNRPNLEMALKLIKKDMAFVTYSLTRLSRSTKDLLEISDCLAKKQADLVLLSERIDTSTPSGKVVFTILGAIGEFERNVTCERTRHVKQYNKKLGRYNGGHIPYGYMLAEDNSLIELKHEQEMLKIVKESYACDMNLTEISKILALEGYFNRLNKPFNPNQIKRILQA